MKASKTITKQQQLELLDKELQELKEFTPRPFLTNGRFQFSSTVQVDLKSAWSDAIIIKMMSAIIQWRDSHDRACIELHKETPFKFSGYTYEEWKNDFMLQLNHIERQTRQTKLNELKNSLITLMSREEKAVSVMDEINKALNL